jgi:ribose/xylose/arabinose/galactoside ABC-type transport system permease subunit
MLQAGVNTVWQTGLNGLLLLIALLANRFSNPRG